MVSTQLPKVWGIAASCRICGLYTVVSHPVLAWSSKFESVSLAPFALDRAHDPDPTCFEL